MSLEDVQNWLALKDIAQSTKEWYERAVTLLVEQLGDDDLGQLSPGRLRAWLDGTGWGNSGRWIGICAVRGFLRWRYGEDHPALALKIKRCKVAPQRVLKKKQVQALLASFDTTSNKGIRDLAICSLMLDSGLRCSEVCRLETRYVDLEERHLRVIIKGGKWEAGVFSEYTARYLSNWLAIRSCFVRPGIKTVFVGVGGTQPGRPFTRGGLQVTVRTWAKRAGIEDLSPHDLRRTFATLATRAGAPARVLQKAGRWSSLDMVERYTASIEAADFAPYFPVSAALDS